MTLKLTPSIRNALLDETGLSAEAPVFNWVSDSNAYPPAAGWYAVLICYEAEEGVFPIAAFWDGQKWDNKAVVAFGGGSCKDKDEAEELAYAHIA